MDSFAVSGDMEESMSAKAHQVPSRSDHNPAFLARDARDEFFI